MFNQQLHFKSSIINYYVFGKGDKVLFCLHGYGENGASFSFLENYLGNDYTLYAIDFPFHGATEWKEKTPLHAKELLDIFNRINEKQTKIFSVLAYSMGGRIALHLLQAAPEKMQRVILIAPDGLRENFWYKLSTQTSAGKKLFKQTMRQPQLFFMFLNLANKTNLLNNSVVKFIHNYLDDEKERILLYKRWMVLRLFKPNLQFIKEICAKQNIRLHFLFGSFDKIILSKRANIFQQSKNIHIKVIEAGHQLLKEKYASYIASLLNN
jgi:pimeloyl-ACP methyl ester carboxylesterase